MNKKPSLALLPKSTRKPLIYTQLPNTLSYGDSSRFIICTPVLFISKKWNDTWLMAASKSLQMSPSFPRRSSTQNVMRSSDKKEKTQKKKKNSLIWFLIFCVCPKLSIKLCPKVRWLALCYSELKLFMSLMQLMIGKKLKRHLNLSWEYLCLEQKNRKLKYTWIFLTIGCNKKKIQLYKYH